MIEIAAAVCLISAPVRCRDISLTFEEAAITPYSCMMYGQGELAKWTEEHPNWRIAKWSCRPAGQIAKL
jgi:hypothetical protein